MTESKAKPASVDLQQIFNAQWRPSGSALAKHFHKVIKTRNTIRVEIGQILNQTEVEDLIRDGVAITIT